MLLCSCLKSEIHVPVLKNPVLVPRNHADCMQCLGDAVRSQRQRNTQESGQLRRRETSGCQVRKPRLPFYNLVSSSAGTGNVHSRLLHLGSKSAFIQHQHRLRRAPSSKPHPRAASRCRRLPRWEASSARLTSRVLAHHELCADPQTLASIASVIGSGSLDGGCADGLLQGENRIASHDRYMDCYAERCCQWGAEGERAETVGHRAETRHMVHTAGNNTAKPLICMVCNTLVHGRRLQCHRCGHGGHSKHVAAWFEFEAECRHEACECLCWETSV